MLAPCRLPLPPGARPVILKALGPLMHEQELPPIPAEFPPSDAIVMENVSETETPLKPQLEPPPETPLEAVRGEDRLEIIDVLRGLCLLGILAANTA